MTAEDFEHDRAVSDAPSAVQAREAVDVAADHLGFHGLIRRDLLPAKVWEPEIPGLWGRP
ncbi:MAG: hypothetical protein M3Y22_08600 [Pseudomonadota bacterium]|nr:hypothetical protein [Pseudomonadota bacterium]